jgi:hypothetical protein
MIRSFSASFFMALKNPSHLPPGIAIPALVSGRSVISVSVARSAAAMEAAFSKAERVTVVMECLPRGVTRALTRVMSKSSCLRWSCDV